MAYTPTPGVFVNGEIIDETDLNTEFGLVSTGMAQDVSDLSTDITQAETDANTYTDTQIGLIEFDGGTF